MLEWTHRRSPRANRLRASRQGNKGSQAVFFRDSCLSHPRKTSQKTPERTKDAMMGALFQGYSRPACSRAKTSRMEAAKEAKAPR